MYPELQLYIDGRWRSGEGRATRAVLNPATGQPIGQLPLASAADLDEAIAAAKRGFEVWRRTLPNERARIIRTAAQLIRERKEQIARIVTLEQGKPISEARLEVAFAAETYDFYAEEGRRAYGRVVPPRAAGVRQIVLQEPVGPCAAFTAWNTPAVTEARKIAGALAAGCSIVLKAAEETPGTGIEMARAFEEAGLPAGVLNLVHGDPATVSSHLIASRTIRKVTFTGSTSVGRHLARLCADNLQRLTLELGGHAPVLVFADADLERTLDILVPGKFRNAGQICVSPTRFYVQEGIYERFATAFAARAGSLNLGSGLEAGTQMGPLANPRRTDAIGALVADAKAAGARVLTGGEAGREGSGGEGFFFRPTVLADVPTEARAMNEEPFGPLALLRPFRDLDEAVEQANRLPFGLAAYCFTENARRANLLGDALEAGMVGINTLALSAADSPFGGVKDSGHGSEDGPEGMDAFLVTKAIHQL